MIAHVLKKSVESYYEKVRQTNPLFTRARSGELSNREINRYLSSILYLIQHTPIHLRMARNEAKERGLSSLVTFFSEKMREESGHDEWAKSDLAALAEKFHGKGAEANPDLSPYVVELVKFLTEVIEADPSLYIAYIFLAEYFTVLAGPDWVRDLEVKCGIPRSMMSVIGNHAELDKGHVTDDLRELDAFLGDPAIANKLVKVLDHAMVLHEKFCAEVGSK